MRALKYNVIIDPGRKLTIVVPPEISEGPAEIILISSVEPNASRQAGVKALFSQWLEEPGSRDPLEILTQIREERDSWSNGEKDLHR